MGKIESVWGPSEEIFVIAEIGLNHNGNFREAKRLVKIAADAGADAVKFQRRYVPNLAISSTLDAADLRFPSLGKTYRELRNRHELTLNQLEQLKQTAEERNLCFFVTPFDAMSLAEVVGLGVDRIKVASHSVTNLPLLTEISAAGLPVLLSTGMCDWLELDMAVELLGKGAKETALLHCVSSYPTKPEEARLDFIPAIAERYGLRTGYSGHEVGYRGTVAAVAAGATIVERHLTSDNDQQGFDHRLSLNGQQFESMVEEVKSIPQMFGSGPKIVTPEEWVTRKKYQVSMVSKTVIRKGETLRPEAVTFKNPGTGLTPAQGASLFGLVAVDDVPSDSILSVEMFNSGSSNPGEA